MVDFPKTKFAMGMQFAFLILRIFDNSCSSLLILFMNCRFFLQDCQKLQNFGKKNNFGIIPTVIKMLCFLQAL